MGKTDDDAPLTLDDEQIVTRRKALGLAALALGTAGALATTAAQASDDSSESGDSAADTGSDTGGDEAEKPEGDGDGD